MEHKLLVYPGSRPVQQRRRKLSLERAQVVEEQVQTLLEAGFIREVKYPAWLANVVLVKKQNGKWRMCVDYTDLNKVKKCRSHIPKADEQGVFTSPWEFNGRCQVEWTPECEEAFQEFKRFLSQPPILTRPEVREELVLYLSIAEKAVASALIREDEVEQHPVYFTSKVLQGPKLRYQKIDIAGRMVQWAIELSEFDLRYETWIAIKAQCLTDFMAEYPGDQEETSTMWELYADGSSNKIGSGAGIILVNQEGTQIEVSLKFEFPASNNHAEYEALIAGLKLAEEVGVTKVVVFSDSQVVTSQINGEYQAKDPNMKRYLDKTLEYLRRFSKTETTEVLEEVHNGICGNHLGARSLARKVIRAGFYWPTLQKDATDFLNKCQPCQIHANFHVAPPKKLISITSPWPFAKWGLDLLGPFPQARGQVKYLIVGVDYFTKWIEAEPLATITAQRSRKFLYKNIVTRYGISHSIITDNGTQFTDSTLRNLVASMNIKHQFTSVEHPQANGHAEAANKVILAGLKKRLLDANGASVEELPQVLWAYRTTPKSAIGETPF
nr:uncharacterized protein LOC112720758 [Arachis hypogaea]